MKIAITASGPDTGSAVDARFGRCAFFLIIDTDTGRTDALEHRQDLSATGGAGIQAARQVADAGVETLITGNVGPKAFAALSAGGIAVYRAEAQRVAEAIAAFESGNLRAVDSANVEGHWV